MPITINGSTGIAGVDGSAGTPALQGADTNTGISFGTDVVSASTAGTERARIDSTGRLLVGTSSSSQATRLVLQGNSASGTDSTVAIFAAGTSTPSNGQVLGYLRFSDSGHVSAADITANRDGGTWTSGSSQPSRLVFSTTADGASSPTERMRIASDGNLRHIAVNSEAFYLSTGLAAGTSNVLMAGYNSGTSTTSLGTNCFQILTNGNVRNTNNSYTAISDIKLKENVVDANSQWEDMKAFRVRNYNLKENQTHKQIGLIAQEVEPISPGLVYESPDRDAEGNDLGTTTKSVQYSVLYMKAIKALQEAMERIETLEAEMTAVKAQLA